MHPDDMARRGLVAGDLMQITNAQGALIAPVRASATLRSGQAHMAMHWGAEWLPSGGVNNVLNPAFDPLSKQPELKHSAVRVQPANLAHHMQAFALLPAEHTYTAFAQLQAAASTLAFASLVRFSAETPDVGERKCDSKKLGVWLHAADHEPFSSELLDLLKTVFDMQSLAQCVQYADPRSHSLRRMKIEGESLTAVLLTGSAAACAAVNWLQPLVAQGTSVRALGASLLKASAAPPDLVNLAVPASPVVCTCFSVKQAAIAAGIASAPVGCDVMAHLQSTLKCGTQCGSCEIGRAHV